MRIELRTSRLLVYIFELFIKSCFTDIRKNHSSQSEVVHESKFSLDIYYKTHVWLAQLYQQQSGSEEVLGSTPTEDSSWLNLFFSFLTSAFVGNVTNFVGKPPFLIKYLIEI